MYGTKYNKNKLLFNESKNYEFNISLLKNKNLLKTIQFVVIKMNWYT